MGDIGSHRGEMTDASGLLVLPGMVDTHLHLMDPGPTEREDFPTVTRAAAARAVTTIVEHTRAHRVRTVEDLRDKAAYLDGRATVDFGLAAHVWPETIDGIAEVAADGITFFEIFTCDTHGVPGLASAEVSAALTKAARELPSRGRSWKTLEETRVGSYYVIEVGDVQLIGLQDSWARREPGGFFVGIGADAWEPYREWLDDDGLMAHNFGCFLIRSRDTTMLVDTGLGPWPNPLDLEQPPALLEVMAEAGTSPEDVDLVLFTHLHWDHTGWNTRGEDGSLELTFPNARYVVQQKEYDYWMGPGEKPSNGPAYERVLAPVVDADRLELVDDEYVATREVAAVPTPGHTPGHVSFAIVSSGQRAYILGDAAHKPVQLTEPDWYPGFDLDPVESTKSRKMILDRAEREQALLAGGHFAYPSMGYVVEVDGRRTFRYVT